MDITTLAMAKAYTNSQRIAWVEENKFYLESIEGKKSIDIGAIAPLYKVSDKVLDANSVICVKGVFSGVELIATIEDCVIVPGEDGALIGYAKYNVALCVIIPNDTEEYEKGIYLIYGDDKNNVSYIEFAQTIHPIDPKYLPGVCLPVVELSTEPTEEGALLTTEEAAMMDALNGACFILKHPYEDAMYTRVPTEVVFDGDTYSYYFLSTMTIHDDKVFILGKQGNDWLFARG